MTIQSMNIHFDHNEILHSIKTVILSDPNFDQQEFEKVDQIALHQCNPNKPWFDGIGSLYDFTKEEFKHTTSEFNTPNPLIMDSYLGNCINTVNLHAVYDGVKIGRIRIMRLKPKTCYTLHTDPEEFRYHIPIKTNNGAFFLIDNKVYRMPELGMLYKFRTDKMHTAVNASFEERIHIVFDTYRV